jgi:DNA repair photolyase
LTKNASVSKDFDLISQYRVRVLVGISLTGTLERESIISAIEPNASSISERMEALKKAHQLGLRTYGMLCPLLHGVSDSPEDIDTLVKFCVECGAEEIFTEAVNPRGNGLILTQDALKHHGFSQEAEAIGKIRQKKEWSAYSTRLIQNIQSSVRSHFDIDKLRVLLYPKSLQPQDKAIIQKDDAGVVWL